MNALEKIMKADELAVRAAIAEYGQRTDDYSRMVMTVCRARLINLGVL